MTAGCAQSSTRQTHQVSGSRSTALGSNGRGRGEWRRPRSVDAQRCEGVTHAVDVERVRRSAVRSVRGCSAVGAGAVRRMTRGTLRDRYAVYVKAMKDLGLPWVDFDTWLNR